MFPTRFTMRRVCVHRNLIHIGQINMCGRHLLRFGCDLWSCYGLPVSWGPLSLHYLVSNARHQLERPHRSRAGKPTIRNPASKDMISDSAELWDADVSCTSNWWRQMFGFRKNTRLPPEVDFESSRLQQSLSLEKILIDNAVLCFPHWQH